MNTSYAVLVRLGMVAVLATAGCVAESSEAEDVQSTESAAIAASALQRMPQTHVQAAIARSLTDFDDKVGNSAWFGSSMVVVAAASFSGNTTADARLKQQLRHNISPGHDPTGAGGFVQQLELRFAVAAAIAKATPRIWSSFTATERKKIDLVMRGLSVGAAYGTSVNNAEIKAGEGLIRNLRGNQQWWKGNPNFKCAGPAVLLAARAYFGSASAVTTFLNQFDKRSFALEVQANNLTNMYETFRYVGPNGNTGPRPTEAEIDTAVKSWRWAINNASLDDAETLYTEIINSTFSKRVNAGLNNGAGFRDDDGQMRGRIMRGAAGLPNKGALGMAHEFDTTDGGGPRSAASYVMFGSRIALDVTTVVAISGLVNPRSAAVQAAKTRMNIGMIDLKYKSENGYYSYAKGGGTSNNEDWTSAFSQSWGFGYTFSQWFDMLKPYLDR